MRLEEKYFTINATSPDNLKKSLLEINKGKEKDGLVVFNRDEMVGGFRCIKENHKMAAIINSIEYDKNVNLSFSIDTSSKEWLKLYYDLNNCYIIYDALPSQSNLTPFNTKKKNVLWQPIFNSSNTIKSTIIYISRYWLKEIDVSLLGIEDTNIESSTVVDTIPLEYQTISLLEQIYELAMNPVLDLLSKKKLVNHLWAIAYNSLFQYRNIINRRRKGTMNDELDNLKLKISNVKHEILRDFSSNIKSLDYWAKYIGTNRTTFQKVFKETHSISFYKFYQEARFNEAIRLLKHNKNMPVKTIAASIGYKSVSYFIKQFQKRFGLTPHEYRNK